MREIHEHNAAEYLRESGRVPAGARVEVHELSGGVSNVVLEAAIEGSPPFVLKQCRERLRVQLDWRARLDRMWFETDALALLATVLPAGETPRVLFLDEPNYLFAMTRAPAEAVVWKADLLAGRFDPAIAERLGEDLGAIHAECAGHPALAGRFADVSLFDELRVDPYYRTIARVHPQIAAAVDGVITTMNQAQRTLVLGDYSPKNILVHSAGLVLLDFECAHAGDATFDCGFFLSHLMLKTVRAGLQLGEMAKARALLDLAHRFVTAYHERLGSQARTLAPRRCEALHALLCMLARVDGKSPVDYLSEAARSFVRSFTLAAILDPPTSWDDLRARLTRTLEKEA